MTTRCYFYGTLALACITVGGCDVGNDEGSSDSDEGSDTSGDTTGTGTETEDRGSSGSDDSSSSSGDGCTDTTEPPYDPGDLPDTSGWEEITISGIYVNGGDFEDSDLLHPCEPSEETWCVYWAVRPFPAGQCRGNVQVQGHLSHELGEFELCNAIAGAAQVNRAFVIEQVDTVGPCDDAMCQPNQNHCSANQPTCEMPGGCE